MNQDLPEDLNLDERSLKTERELRSLQPRATAFDAATILAAAGDETAPRDSQPAPRSQSHGDTAKFWRIRLPASTRIVTASAFCGAVVGALLMYIVISPHVSGDGTTPQHDVADSDNKAGDIKAGDIKAGDGILQLDAEIVDGKRVDSPNWSRPERLVSEQLRSLNGPRKIGEPTLMAHSLLGASADNEQQEPPGTPEFQEPWDIDELVPNRPIGRDDLLRQLLGNSPFNLQ